jgi:hypothetical protein
MLRAPRSLLALFIAFGLVAAACGDDGESSRRPTGSDGLTMAEMQVLGSHNSYHQKPTPEAQAGLELVSADLAADTDYGHEPIGNQLTTYGMRQLEIDVFADPDGGLFADRQALPIIGLPVESGERALDEPGFKVLHRQDYDFETSCLTLIDCLGVARDWSDANPDHLPLMIYIEAKSDRVEDEAAEGGVSLDGLPIEFTEPVPFTREVFDDLEAEILEVFPPDRVFTPDELRRDHDTLRDAVLEDGWPTVDEMRGQVFFGLIDTGEDRDVYRGDAPSLEGRLLFTSADPGDPDAAFIRVDDPIEDGDLIGELVTDGFLVRTRADTPTDQARSGDVTRRDAAIASGAQYVSTDYYKPDPALSEYMVSLPGGAVAVCNPVSARADCDPAELTE